MPYDFALTICIGFLLPLYPYYVYIKLAFNNYLKVFTAGTEMAEKISAMPTGFIDGFTR